MIDKTQLIVRMVIVASLAAMTSGCWLDRPLKNPPPNKAVVKSASVHQDDGEMSCNEVVNNSASKVAIVHVDIAHPEQTQLFPQLQTLLSQRLMKKSLLEGSQHFSDARSVALQPYQVSLMGMVNSDMKSQIREIGRSFDSQIIARGTISKIEAGHDYDEKKSKEAHPLDNISEVIDEVADKLLARSWRKVTFKLQLFDSYSGESIIETETEQHISMRTGEPHFLLAKSDDKRKLDKRMLDDVDSLIEKQISIIDGAASCINFKTPIVSTDNGTAMINVTLRSQILVDDRFDLVQPRLVHTDSQGFEQVIEEKVGTLRITQVKAGRATGKVEMFSRTAELKQGDLAISH